MNQMLESIIVKAGDSMANPQKENGYVPISNELIDQLCKTKLNGTQFRIILLIFRYTYGFNRKSWKLSTSFISEGTNCNIRQVKKEVKALVDMNIILINKNFKGTSSRDLRINKNYDQWLIAGNKSAVTGGDKLDTSSGDKLDTSSGGKLAPQLNTKDKYKDKYICAFDFETLWKEYPKKKGKSAINKKSIKEMEKIGTEKMLECIRRYKDEITRNKIPEQFIMYGSTFFNGRYADYLDSDCDSGTNVSEPSAEELELVRRLRNQ